MITCFSYSMVMILFVGIRVSHGVVKGVKLIVGSEIAVRAGPVVIEGSARDSPSNGSKAQSTDIIAVSNGLEGQSYVTPPLTC